jgi:hypothetical protein
MDPFASGLQNLCTLFIDVQVILSTIEEPGASENTLKNV